MSNKDRQQYNLIGIGEVLWDLLPEGKRPGGAPANFAYTAQQLGNRGVILSRVGADDNGRQLVGYLRSRGISTDLIQTDQTYPTGSVRVDFAEGEPAYQINKPAAWDFLEFSAEWSELAGRADAVCFGSLGQRGGVSRTAIQKFLGSVSQDTLKIFDPNLRQDFYSVEVLRSSLRAADLVKLNREEFEKIGGMFDLAGLDNIEKARDLLAKFDARMVCLTLGERGSLLVLGDQVSQFNGFQIKVKDPVGAGDAFTAGLAHGLLRGWPLEKINTFANRTGAFVAANHGAMPDFGDYPNFSPEVF